MTKEEFSSLFDNQNIFNTVVWSKTSAYEIISFNKETRVIQLKGCFGYKHDNIDDETYSQYEYVNMSGEAQAVLFILRKDLDIFKNYFRRL